MMVSFEKMFGRLIIASNRLPVTVTDKNNQLTVNRSTGGVATALDAIFKNRDTKWVGWMGLRRLLSDAELKGLRMPAGLVPINLSTQEVRRYYDRTANGTLYPSFLHYVPGDPCDEADWQAMIDVNRRFAEKIKFMARPNDIIWVHDYHLLLLPYYLRQTGVTNRIGFFLHTPFPDVPYLKLLPYARHIVESLAEADLIGFQTQRDVARFRKAHRTLLPKRTMRGSAQHFPIGVDYEQYHDAHKMPLVVQHAKEARQEVGNKQVLFSISRLDYVKGIVTQLRAVEKFLAGQPASTRKHFVYKLVVAPSREDLEEYRRHKQEIERTVNRINKRLGTKTWGPIIYTYRSFGFEELSAWYQLADVVLVASRVDGMNLIAKEYIAARQDDRGMLVLSNSIGVAVQLNKAVLVDAADVADIASGLRRAFAMPMSERRERWASMRRSVKEENIFWWANCFIQALLSPQAAPKLPPRLSVTAEAPAKVTARRGGETQLL